MQGFPGGFDSEAAQIDWLIRFRELDAALVSRGQMGALPAGTVITLADLPPAVAVTHPGMAAGQLDVLQQVFSRSRRDASATGGPQEKTGSGAGSAS